MATTRIVLGIICLIGAIGNRLPNGHLLTVQNTLDPAQSHILSVATTQLGVKEKGANNHGKEVAAYLAYTHLKENNPWCAAFVSWVYGQAGFGQPRTAWSPALFPKNKIIKNPEPATVFGIYFPQLKRIAHCGLVRNTKNYWVITIEGNTNLGGSNDGDGVYSKWRHRKTIAVFARWLPQKGVQHE